MARRLALFDLDNTLLAGDSDHAWGEFLISKQLVEETTHRAENDRYYQQYREGKLDIHAYVRFTLLPILALSRAQRLALHAEFMRNAITPLYLPKADALVEQHLNSGDLTVIVTATNEFITQPIAERFRVEHLIATELEMEKDRFTGRIEGIPCYQFGKVEKLEKWLQRQTAKLSLNEAVFYSDSINDLPLLERVAVPVAVDPDAQLHAEATSRGWKIISLR
ncbi:MAG: HAD family hydrolase [Gammaproteobacteria bacterium]|nr:HAD family hydrolase [Gammaproteobacteria bacterium]